jgi:hypothetical protein
MSDAIPPLSDADDSSPDLGTVPPKPEPASTTPTVSVGGGTRPNMGRPTSPIAETTGGGTRQDWVPPTPSTSPSAKPLVIGLSVAAAGLVAFSGYEFLQARGLQEQLDEANNYAASTIQTNQTLESDLKKAREGLAAEGKAHEVAMSEKDEELKAALAKAEGTAEELAKESEKTKGLLEKIEAANAAGQEQARLEGELAELKGSNQELANAKVKIEEEMQRLTREADKSKPMPSTPSTSSMFAATQAPAPAAESNPTRNDEEPEVREERKKSNSLAWVELAKYETGENKGRWYFVAPGGFVSPLYFSREMAVRAAELRAGHPQPRFGTDAGTRGAGVYSGK